MQSEEHRIMKEQDWLRHIKTSYKICYIKKLLQAEYGLL